MNAAYIGLTFVVSMFEMKPMNADTALVKKTKKRDLQLSLKLHF